MSKPSRNDPCPCGSGRKYKQCCGQNQQQAGNWQQAFQQAVNDLNQGNFTEAIRIGEALVQSGVKQADIFSLLTMAYYNTNRLNDAEMALQQQAKLQPKNAEVLSNLCLLQHRLGKQQDAFINCKQALSNAPDYAPAYNNLGNVLLAIGQLEEAENNYRKAMQLAPKNVLHIANLGYVLKLRSKYSEAEQILKKALAIDPGFAFAQSALGIVLVEQNKFDEALQHLQKAVELEPKNPDFINNLGLYWQKQGNVDKARSLYEESLCLNPGYEGAYVNLALLNEDTDGAENETIVLYKKALKINPQNPVALLNLGEKYLEEDRHAQAIECLRTALKSDPANSKVYAANAKVMVAEENLDEAERFIHKALEIAPDDTFVMQAYAKYMAACRDFNAAIAIWKKVIEQAPDDIKHYLGLAETYRFANRYDEAAACYEAAIKKFPNKSIIYWGWARLEEFRHNLEKAEVLANEALAINDSQAFRANIELAKICARRKQYAEALACLSQVEQVYRQNHTEDYNLQFEKGKYLDKLHRYPEAFACFTEASNLKNRMLGLNYQIDDGWINKLEEVFSDNRAKSLRPCEVRQDTPQPIFIVGFPRSGTSLMEQILARHPDVIAGGELLYIYDLTDTAFGSRLLEAEQPYPASLLSLRDETIPAALNRLRDYYLDKVRTDFNHYQGRWITDKLPLNSKHLGLIHLLFPASPIIYMLRHPLDTCFSSFISNFGHRHAYTASLEVTAKYYVQVMRLRQFYREHLPLKYKEVHYEALVENQEQVTREVLEFVGLPWNDVCLKYYESRRVVHTASHAQVTEKIYTSSKYRYRNYFEQLKPLFPILADTTAELGYEISAD